MKKRCLFYFIIGSIIFSSVTAYAFSMSATDIDYKNTITATTTVEDALNDIYNKISSPIVLQYAPGSNVANFNKFDMRIPIISYSGIYKHFKIIHAASYPSVSSLCNSIYFNTVADKTSGNVEVNVEYNTKDFATLYTYVTGNAGCFFRLEIQLYN